MSAVPAVQTEGLTKDYGADRVGLATLAGSTAVLTAVAVAGFARRDLRG